MRDQVMRSEASIRRVAISIKSFIVVDSIFKPTSLPVGRFDEDQRDPSPWLLDSPWNGYQFQPFHTHSYGGTYGSIRV